MSHLVKAVIFDLDGVIAETSDFHRRAWKALVDYLRIDVNEKLFDDLKGINRVQSLEMILANSNPRLSLSEQEKEELSAWKNKYYIKSLESLSPLAILPGISLLLDTLEENNVKIAVASSSENVFQVLEKLELNSKIDVVVDPRKIANGKPHPDIFLEAVEQLKFNVDECVGIEDAASGIMAIKKANIASIAIGEKDNFKHINPDLILETTSLLNMKQINHALINHRKNSIQNDRRSIDGMDY